MPPEAGELAPRAWEPDLYGDRVAHWRDLGHCVVDGRAMITGYDGPATDLYGPDRQHLSPQGNRLLAEAIVRTVPDAFGIRSATDDMAAVNK
jgi:hypothetical protein